MKCFFNQIIDLSFLFLLCHNTPQQIFFLLLWHLFVKQVQTIANRDVSILCWYLKCVGWRLFPLHIVVFMSQWSPPADQQGNSPACVQCWPSNSHLSHLLSSPQSETQSDSSTAQHPSIGFSFTHSQGFYRKIASTGNECACGHWGHNSVSSYFISWATRSTGNLLGHQADVMMSPISYFYILLMLFN